MDYQYSVPDPPPPMAGRTHFPAIPQASEPFLVHRNLTLQPPQQLYPEFGSTTLTPITATCGLEMECDCQNNGRWPRQETLTLLEIRSRLDHSFREANQKAPLWDEVSRMMRDEYGYQRSGRKCKEKFENLYKYYKKTKEGKTGRHDGKHYRFFRQLEALCGEPNNQDSNPLVYPISTTYQEDQNEFENSSSENNGFDLSAIALTMNRSSKKKKKWIEKIEGFVESHMKKLMERQEAWMEKMLSSIEHKEHARRTREEEWRKHEAARLDQKYEILANERACIEARDAALMEALQKFTRKQLNAALSKEENYNNKSNWWVEAEMSSLIQVRTSMEPKFEEYGFFRERLWEEVAAKMGLLGYDVSAERCKETWDNISTYFDKNIELKKNSTDSYNGLEFVKLEHEAMELQPSDNATLHGSCFERLLNEMV